MPFVHNKKGRGQLRNILFFTTENIAFLIFQHLDTISGIMHISQSLLFMFYASAYIKMHEWC